MVEKGVTALTPEIMILFIKEGWDNVAGIICMINSNIVQYT